MTLEAIAGWHHHAAATGDLVDSLYAAGCRELRRGPADPSPGVASVGAVMPRLRLERLNRVVSIEEDPAAVLVQSRCSLSGLTEILEQRGWALAGTGKQAPGGQEQERTMPNSRTRRRTMPSSLAWGHRAGDAQANHARTTGALTVGAALLRGLLTEQPGDWADVLQANGRVERYGLDHLPPDALLVLLRLSLLPCS